MQVKCLQIRLLLCCQVDLEGLAFGASEHWRCQKAYLVVVNVAMFVFFFGMFI